jgi:NTE family protein
VVTSDPDQFDEPWPTGSAGRTTAFVLWGGGSLGAVQVGMLRALTAAGIRPDLVVGTSVGALNGVHYAADPSREGVEELATLWQDIGGHDVFPVGMAQVLEALLHDLPFAPLRGLRRALGMGNYAFSLNPWTLCSAVIGRGNHLVDSGQFEKFLNRVLPVDTLESTHIPVEAMATDVCSGAAVPIDGGPALGAVLASTAIPAVYPNVRVDGRLLMDGDVADHTGLDRAVELGADEVYLLAPRLRCPLPAPPSSALAMAVHAYHLLAQQRMAAAVARVADRVRLHRIPAPPTSDVLPVDFSHTAEMVEQATETAGEWLRSEHGEPSHSRFARPHRPARTAGLRAVAS